MYKRLGWAFRRRLMLSMGIEPFDERNYIQKVLSPDAASGYDPASLIQFLPQNEGAGLISYDHSGLGHDGAYTAVNLGQPGVPGSRLTSADYDGATSYNNIWSAGLAGDFDGREGSLVVWDRVSGAGVWTDGTHDRVITLYDDPTNFISIVKWNVNNRMDFYYTAGGITETFALTPINDLTWMSFGMTWSVTAAGGAGEFKTFYNDAQVGATQPIGGVFAGAITIALLGSWTVPPNQPWNGWKGPAILYDAALAPASMSYLGTI